MRLVVSALKAIRDILTVPPPAPCCAAAIRWANFR